MFAFVRSRFASLALILALAVPTASALACGDEADCAGCKGHHKTTKAKDSVKNTSAAAQQAGGEKLALSKFKIEGMTCGGCESMIRAKLNEVPGIKTVEFTTLKAKKKKTQNLIEIAYAPGTVTADQVIKAVAAAGEKYKATPITN